MSNYVQIELLHSGWNWIFNFMGNEFKKTKVWQVIWGLKDGGAEVLAREYARLLDKKKFDVTIVTMYPFEDTANYHRAVEEKLKVVSIFKKRNSPTYQNHKP